jgi:SAM-dependent methyltransferase
VSGKECIALLRCLSCQGKLEFGSEQYACAACGIEWPVSGPIPRFAGVTAHNETGRRLLAAARRGTWQQAVRSSVPKSDHALFGISDGIGDASGDLQRTPWIAMLGLDPAARALEIGCSYGAATAALARSVRELYSVESDPSRLEFTHERLQQEGIGNVRLIEALPGALPFAAASFDLIVLTAGLDSAGYNGTSGASASRVNFLRKIRGLLKADGCFVLGGVNRFSYRRIAATLSGRDTNTDNVHSYSDSARGYRLLLQEAGFGTVSGYWAEPSRDCPYHLVPLDVPRWVREHYLEMLNHPAPSPRDHWYRGLKRVVAATPALMHVLPEFLFFARQQPPGRTPLHSWIEQQLQSPPLRNGSSDSTEIGWALHTREAKPSAKVRLGNLRTGREHAYINVVTASRDNFSGTLELANQEIMSTALKLFPAANVAIPDVCGELQSGCVRYAMQAPARGTQLSRRVRQPGYFRDRHRVEADFDNIFAGMVTLTESLQNVPAVRAAPDGWRSIPAEIDDPAIRTAITRARHSEDSARSVTWVQHGDLSVEHVFFDEKTGRIEVLDWADLAGGLPPLYDFFQLLLSAGYLCPADERAAFRDEEELWAASFAKTFLEKKGFAVTAQNMLVRACERFNLPREQLRWLMLEFLVVRAHYYRVKSPVQQRIHLRLLRDFAQQEFELWSRG